MYIVTAGMEEIDEFETEEAAEAFCETFEGEWQGSDGYYYTMHIVEY